jgi:hypothetical protein
MAANCMILYSSILKENEELDTRFNWSDKWKYIILMYGKL